MSKSDKMLIEQPTKADVALDHAQYVVGIIDEGFPLRREEQPTTRVCSWPEQHENLARQYLEIQTRVGMLEEIVMESRRGRGEHGCWCEIAIGNPMLKDHTGLCKKTRALMEGRQI
jgi:hypothetical protein